MASHSMALSSLLLTHSMALGSSLLTHSMALGSSLLTHSMAVSGIRFYRLMGSLSASNNLLGHGNSHFLNFSLSGLTIK